MLHRRLLSSAFSIAAVLALIRFDYLAGEQWGYRGVVISVVVLILCLLGGEELRRLLGPDELRTWQVAIPLGLCGGLSCIPVFWREPPGTVSLAPSSMLVLGYAAAWAWMFLSEMLWYRQRQNSLVRIQRLSLIVGYLLLLMFTVQLRFALTNRWGVVAIFSLLLTVKTSDSFAYLVGKAWGRSKLTPQLSPGKTIEGGLAALIFGCAGALFALYPVSYWMTGEFAVANVWSAVAFGVSVSAAGIGGDLAESLIKRESNQKDSGSLIPGMGGVLDVIDSVLGAAPLAFFFWVSRMVGPT